jgi:hypothetical protein
MRFLSLLALFALLCVFATTTTTTLTNAKLVDGFRPPAIPIILLSPTTNVWQMTDKMTDDFTRHWAGNTMAFAGIIRIDGSSYTFMGNQVLGSGIFEQTNVVVQPTQTIITWAGKGVQLTVTFSQSAFIDQPDLYALPLCYITWSVVATDGQSHNVQLYFDQAADTVVNDMSEYVTWGDVSANIKRYSPNGRVLALLAYDQIPFEVRGDTTRTNWGVSYLATQSKYLLNATHAFVNNARMNFSSNVGLPPYDTKHPRSANDEWPGSVLVYDLGSVSSTVVTDYHIFVYDDIETMSYFHNYQTPYWKQLYNDVYAMLSSAFTNYQNIMTQCDNFDATLIDTLTKAGGDQYATIASLAYRQVVGATVLTWNAQKQDYWGFMKEISSDGDVSTVDVIYPASPFFVMLGPEILRRTIIPVLEYAMNYTDVQYDLPWAPHHLGAWPVCDLPSWYQEQMPMEESANLLIMLAGIAQQQNFDVTYLKQYSPALQIWVDYLNSTLPDPGEQLCTDDFEGPSPHNVNLALKGILGIGSYALLQKYSGNTDAYNTYISLAQGYVKDWMSMANDGNHYRLQYNLPNTWSIKYNLVWDYILDLNLFPTAVATNELSYYISKANQYGVPLDSRGSLTKVDWMSWAAAMGSSDQADAVFNYLYNFANSSPSRVPLSDYYDTNNNKVIGFKARPVVGGLYAHALLKQQQAKREAERVQAF